MTPADPSPTPVGHPLLVALNLFAASASAPADDSARLLAPRVHCPFVRAPRINAALTGTSADPDDLADVRSAQGGLLAAILNMTDAVTESPTLRS